MSKHKSFELGDKFGRLTVIGPPIANKNIYRYLCRCECGIEKTYLAYYLRNGIIVSCGCYRTHMASVSKTTHGLRKSPLYDRWGNIKQRCYNSKHPSFKNYGVKGITMCEEWHDFAAFEKWARESGFKSGLTIDRIDSMKSYEPSNCRWLTLSENTKHRWHPQLTFD